jgi:hypothetical protein
LRIVATRGPVGEHSRLRRARGSEVPLSERGAGNRWKRLRAGARSRG